MAAFTAPVVAKRSFGCAAEMVLETPPHFRAEPGQFVHVYCGSGSGRILRRPFSLFDVQSKTFSLLVKVVGAGSAWLVGKDIGEHIDCLGPLGRGFTLPSNEGNSALVAGGTGIAPLVFLENRLKQAGIRAAVYWGMEYGRDYGGLPDMLVKRMELHTASEDGSLGFRGSVLGLLHASPAEELSAVYACGPKGMLAGLAETIDSGKYSIFQVSLEERMACGVGACRGCAVPCADPDGGYLAVCKDGPVFDLKELDWKRIEGLIWE